MNEAVSNLYRVTVAMQRGEGSRSWNVLVRAVDEESAAGAVRARGHNVVGVAVGEMPRPSAGTPRISCVNCGYLLKKLPVGEAGETLCPECGVVNTPLAGSDSVWEEIKATRAEWGKQRTIRPMWSRPISLVLFATAFVAIMMAVVIPFLRWVGWML